LQEVIERRRRRSLIWCFAAQPAERLQILPALIERANPREVQILWDEVPKTGDIVKAQAEALAAIKRGEVPATGAMPPFGVGTTVKIVGDLSKITPEQREKLRAMGIDLDTSTGPPLP